MPGTNTNLDGTTPSSWGRLVSRPALRTWSRRTAIAGIVGLGCLLIASSIVWQNYPFPYEKLDEWPTSPMVTDRAGEPLLQLVGRDDQWRQPVELSDISPWLVKATIAAEDERFWEHQGIDPIAVLRAIQQNIQAGGIKSGASTLSMQLCRMVDDRPRTLSAKCIEAVRAVQLERTRSKNEILAAYLNLAPYGGNIRGVEAAAKFYFGKRAADLSLGEATLLAGVPQWPSRLRPDTRLASATRRREYVLARMEELGHITSDQRQQATSEPVTVHRERQITPSQVGWLALWRRPHGGRTTIDSTLQRTVESFVSAHRKRLPNDSDVAAIVIDIATSEIVALVGSADPSDPVDGQINGAVAHRSPGSALKPFLYATAFAARRLRPDSIVTDDPESFTDWTPENFDREYAGPLTAGEALRASRNIPAIHITQSLGLERCLGVLESVGINLPRDAQRRGGLTLAVGGIETTLLDLTNAYATLGRRGQRSTPRLFLDESQQSTDALPRDVCDAINDLLSVRHRTPMGMEPGTRLPWFMWKTGTSSGRRDAWAIGHNQRFAMGVWVGRFSGVGHQSFVGREVAEPLLARLMCHAAFRHDVEPPHAELWQVLNPLPTPESSQQRLAIAAPLSGEVFVSFNGRAVVHPQATLAASTGETNWFLNGRHLGSRRPERLELEPGSYELRCVTDAGRIAATKFRVE